MSQKVSNPRSNRGASELEPRDDGASSGSPADTNAPDNKDGAFRLTADLAVLVAVLSFAATAAIVDRGTTPIMPVVTRKLERFAAEKDSYTVVFIGTSLVYHGFAPTPFAEEMRRLGHEERAFNFGASHLCLGEALRVEDYVISLHPKNLRRIVFDLELYPDLDDENRDSTRDVWWHTPSATYASIRRDLSDEPKRKGTTFDHVLDDLQTFARHVTAVGRFSDVFRSTYDPAISQSWDQVDHDDDAGYHPYDDLPSQARRRERFLRASKEWSYRVDERIAHTPRPRRYTAYERAQLDALVRRAREAGYQAILLQMPDLQGDVRLGPREPGADATVRTWEAPRLSFNDPALYPELFEIESRFDVSHLSGQGAVLFSQHFARAYAKVAYPAAGALPGAPHVTEDAPPR